MLPSKKIIETPMMTVAQTDFDDADGNPVYFVGVNHWAVVVLEGGMIKEHIKEDQDVRRNN